MKLMISEIRKEMTTALKEVGYDINVIPFIIEMYLGGELRGHTSHGLASFASFVKQDFSDLFEPEVLLETASLFMIDAKSNPGTVVGKRAIDEAIKRAEKEVVGTAIIKNMDSWLRPGGVAQYAADRGYLCLVMNNGGGTSIAPPGGYDPTLGTNPIAYALPTNEESLADDIATSKRAWGQVRLANKYGTDLPGDTYYDGNGNVTLDPKKAHSVKSFGEHKGYSLALLVEVMCGSLLGMEMMVESTAKNNFGSKSPERGAFILVIDPGQTHSLAAFKQDNSEMLEKIKKTKAIADESIRIPGERAGKLEQDHIKSNELEIPEDVWQEILALKT